MATDIKTKIFLFSLLTSFPFVSLCLRGNKLKTPNEPNFQKNSLTLSEVMAGTYNANMLINREKKRTQNGTKMNKNRKKTTQNQRKRANFHPKNNSPKPNFYPVSLNVNFSRQGGILILSPPEQKRIYNALKSPWGIADTTIMLV